MLNYQESDGVMVIGDDYLHDVSGGTTNWYDIGYSVGSGLGWFYTNVMIGRPW